MATIASINTKTVAQIASVNSKARVDIASINGVVMPSYIEVYYDQNVQDIDNTETRINQYDGVILTGRKSGDLITLSVYCVAVLTQDISSITFYWSKNSTSSWTQIANFTGSGAGSYNLTGIDSDDIVRIRIDVQGSGVEPVGDGTVELTGGSLTSGSGTVNEVSPLSWQIGLGVV